MRGDPAEAVRLRRISPVCGVFPAIVAFLSPQPALSLVSGTLFVPEHGHSERARVLHGRRGAGSHGRLSYMSFDRDGDAGTAAALQDALAEIAEGESQRLTEMIDKAPPGPIKTQWGLG